MKQQQQDQVAHSQKYKQFVEAMQTGNSSIMQSLGLTAEEFQAFSETFQQQTEALDEKFSAAVDSIVENWSRVNEGFGESVNSTVGEIIKLENEITELTNQQWDLKDEALDKNREKIAENQAKINELRGTTGIALGEMGSEFTLFGQTVTGVMEGTLTSAMENAGRDFIALGDAAKKGLDSIKLGILSGDFTGAINGLATAIDGVPERYQGNFAKIDSIIGNTALTNRQKVAQMVADYGSLEQAFKPLINGAYELSLSQAEVAAGLDEVSVAARANMTDMGQMGSAWNTFLGALSQPQKDLPIIQDLIARVNAGVISYSEALAEAEAAGVAWSRTLGTDVMTSIQNVEKSFIDLGNGTTAMVANVNGQMVNLGSVSTTEIGKFSTNLKTPQGDMKTLAQTAKTELEGNTTKSIQNLVTQGTAQFVDLSGSVKTESSNMTTWFDGFINSATSALTSFGQKAKTALGEVWKFITGGGIQQAFADDGSGGGGGVAPFIDSTLFKQKLAELNTLTTTTVNQIRAQFTTMEASITATFGRIGTVLATPFLPLQTHSMTITSQTSAAFITMEAAIKGVFTRITPTFTTAFAQLQPAANMATSMTSAVFVTMETAIKGVFTRITPLFATVFAGLLPAAQTATSMTSAQFITMHTSISGTLTQITNAVNTWATAITSASLTAGQGIMNNFVNPAQQGLKLFATSIDAINKGYTAFAGGIAKGSLTAGQGVMNNFVKPANQGLTTFTQQTVKTNNAYGAFSKAVQGFSQQAASAIKSFASAAVSALNKVASAAKSATSALNSMAAAARKAAQARASVGGMQHGGAFIASTQKGYSGIVNTPTTFKGVRMGEGFAPELVTVQPLTRGTGNHQGPTVSSNIGGRGNGGRAEIHIHVEVGGREYQKIIKQVALGDYGLQV